MKFGPYEIGSVLGVGGMGEVYRAKDTRLGRDVAIKVLSEHLLQDPSFRTRLQQEARSAAQLNHPNVVAVYDAGEDYIVSEYVEGVTLRNLKAPSIRQALNIAAQVAEALAAAHGVGIVHRDIKPENIMVTGDGRAKVLDFGLAKPMARAAAAAAGGPVTLTEPGMVIGTVFYMSPEQVRGADVDHRSDIFSLGLVLYELLAGRKAFARDSAAEVMSAILKEDPPALPPNLPAGVAYILTQCLEKEPNRRFQSAHDLSLGLRALSTASNAVPVAEEAAPVSKPRRRWLSAVAVVLLAAAMAVAGAFAGKRLWPSEPPVFEQVTFQRGDVAAARFGPQESLIVYSARWEDQPSDLYLKGLTSHEARSLGLQRGYLFSVSANNELAVALDCRPRGDNSRTGNLAVVPLYGGAPRSVLPDVSEADWHPSGSQLAVVREVGGWNRLEYPVGRVLYQTSGWIGDLRFSPRGDRIAFSLHPTRDDDRGRVVTVDLSGKVEPLSEDLESIEGLAWTKDASEVWYAASDTGYADVVYAAAPGKAARVVTRFPVPIKLLDLGSGNKLLFATRDDDQETTWAKLPDSEQERNLDWLGSGYPADLSQDGTLLLYTQYGQAGGANYSVYIRKLGDAMPIRLGQGDGIALSPDGRYALALQYGKSERLALYQYQAAAAQLLPARGLSYQPRGQWFPDSRRILFEASENGRPSRVWVQETPAGAPQAITPEGVRLEGAGLKPDGTAVAARGPDGTLQLFPIGGGSPAPVPGVLKEDMLVRWRPDGKKLIVMAPLGSAARLDEVDVIAGTRTRLKDIAGPPSGNVSQFSQMLASSDGGVIVYGATRRVRTLRVAQGLK